MESVQHLEAWHDLYVMLGTSSAALLGLLYVVTSLHLDEIVNDGVYRNRARSNSHYLLITLVEAALILTPQPMAMLGAELAVVNLFGAAVNFRNLYRFLRNLDVSRRGGMALHRAITFLLGFILGIAGGITLLMALQWGIYLVTASYLILLVSVALNAWSIMLGVGQAEGTERANRAARRARP